ncbi:MAG: ribonuclease PH, partial [Bifidobacteriaceae bacterium]|nr:ribonuclease PH [Bifidobacteriaceae bacterium]
MSDINIIRKDSRTTDQLRDIKITTNSFGGGEANVLVEFGNTKVLCIATVETKLPKWRERSGLGWVTAEYAMLPRATNDRNRRESVAGKVSGRTSEISRLIGRSLRGIVDFKKLGENMITVDCDVLQADGGTRTASITGGYVALYQAVKYLENGGFLPRGVVADDVLKDQVAAISVGVVDGAPMLDLCYT